MAVVVVVGSAPDAGARRVTDALRALAARRGPVTVLAPGAAAGPRLSPAAAARGGGEPVDVLGLARTAAELPGLVVVEEACGLLVRYDEEGTTVADLARTLRAQVLVVTALGVGGLNATALTLEALAHRGLDLAGVVVGRWPAEPDAADRSDARDLETLAARPLAGALRADLDPAGAAEPGLAPAFGGRFDPASLRG